MKVIYSGRALADLEQIASYYSSHANPSVSDDVQQRFLDVIEHVRRSPEIAPRVAKRSDVRVSLWSDILLGSLSGPRRHDRHPAYPAYVAAADRLQPAGVGQPGIESCITRTAASAPGWPQPVPA